MGWAARAKVRSGNPQRLGSTAGGLLPGYGKVTSSDGTRYVGSHGTLMRLPRKLRGKALVKAAKRARVYRDGILMPLAREVA